MAKVETVGRYVRMKHITGAATPVRINDPDTSVLAFKVRSTDAEYYIYSNMGGKNPTDNPGDFPTTGDNVYGPFPQADETSAVIGYHEVSAEMGPIWIGGIGTAKIELICW